jgi:D-inositol-3-phosphate glycosyltransferase
MRTIHPDARAIAPQPTGAQAIRRRSIATMTLPPSRILFVLEYFPPHVGGVETLFAHLTAALVAEGHTVTVVTLRLPGTKAREVRDGVRIVRVPTPQRARRYLFTLLAFPVALRHALCADLVHTTTYNAGFPGWFAAFLTRKPVALTVHEVFGEQWNNLTGMHPLAGYGFRAFEWALLHLPFAQYLCSSEFTRGRLVRLIGVPPERAHVAYPAMDYAFWDRDAHAPRDLKAALGLRPETFLSLYFGRPGISKGVEYLIDAAAIVRERLPDSHLLLLLADDPLDHYQRLLGRIDDLGLHGAVTVLPPVPRPDLPGYLLAVDAVVIPSVSEGFGYAAVEAVTLGCTVIATTGHSVEEVVGEAVELVPPRDPQAIAAALLRAAQTPPQRRTPRRFDLAGHIAVVKRAYARMLAAGRRYPRGRR